MKCLKNITTGNIIRVDDKQAHQMSGSTWKYVSKEEWKQGRTSQKSNNSDEVKEKKSNPKQMDGLTSEEPFKKTRKNTKKVK